MKNTLIALLFTCFSILIFLSFSIFCYAEDTYIEQKITASDEPASGIFGRSVSIAKDYLMVGSYGAAYIFKHQKKTWIEVAKLEPNDGILHGQFGRSVSITGNYALIGDWYDSDKGEGAGAAYIFKRNGNSWIQVAKLTASDGSTLDRFGEPVSVTDSYAIIGARSDNGDDGGSGAAYIFKRHGNTWIETAKLTASDASAIDYFGCSVSMTNHYAIIGNYTESAYIFKRQGNAWIETAKLTASDTSAEDRFGCNVSITDNYAIVGAHGDDDYGQYSGSAYIFKRNRDAWTQVAKLTASDGIAFDGFGSSVSLTDKSAIIGAFFPETGDGSGFAYIFKRNGKNWIQVAKLTASDAIAWDSYGTCVSTTNAYAVVGAPGNSLGAVYIYGIDRSRPIGCDNLHEKDNR